jgi:hypothetical protein
MNESEELRLALKEIERLKDELRYSRETVQRNRQMVAELHTLIDELEESIFTRDLLDKLESM